MRPLRRAIADMLAAEVRPEIVEAAAVVAGRLGGSAVLFYGSVLRTGDLDGLLARLDALGPTVAEQRAARKAERAKATAEAKEAKERFVAEAEKLALSNDWRGGVNRFRDLLDAHATPQRALAAEQKEI